MLATATPDAEEAVYVAQERAWAAAADLSEPRWQRVEIPYEEADRDGTRCSTAFRACSGSGAVAAGGEPN